MFPIITYCTHSWTFLMIWKRMICLSKCKIQSYQAADTRLSYNGSDYRYNKPLSIRSSLYWNLEVHISLLTMYFNSILHTVPTHVTFSIVSHVTAHMHHKPHRLVMWPYPVHAPWLTAAFFNGKWLITYSITLTVWSWELQAIRVLIIW